MFLMKGELPLLGWTLSSTEGGEMFGSAHIPRAWHVVVAGRMEEEDVAGRKGGGLLRGREGRRGKDLRS